MNRYIQMNNLFLLHGLIIGVDINGFRGFAVYYIK